MTTRSRWRLGAVVLTLVIAWVTAYGAGAPHGPTNRAAILALGATFLYALLTVIERHTTRPGPTALDEVTRPRPPRADRPTRLTALEDLAAVGADKAQGTHRHLRPYLRGLLRDRLRSRGIELDTDPRVPGLLGPETWDLVRPDRPAPADDRSRGLTTGQVQALTDALNRLMAPGPATAAPPTAATAAPPTAPPTPSTPLERSR